VNSRLLSIHGGRVAVESLTHSVHVWALFATTVLRCLSVRQLKRDAWQTDRRTSSPSPASLAAVHWTQCIRLMSYNAMIIVCSSCQSRRS